MDIRTLPETERQLYNNLRKTYSLHFHVQKFGDHQIRVLKPSDLGELLDGRDPFDDVSSFPFWSRLWESALCLGTVLASTPAGKGARLLELGAGLGAPGLAAAAAGFQVTLSDYDPMILDFQKISASANRLDQVQTRLLDWLDPPELEPYDILAGAEILFREDFVDPLLNICKNYLKADGTIYLAHDVRRKCLPIFLERAEKDFVIGSKKQTMLKADGATDILLNRLRLRK